MYHHNYPASPSLHSKMVSQHFKASENVFIMKHTIWNLVNREPANHAITWQIICKCNRWKCTSLAVEWWDRVIVCCYECDALRFAVISNAWSACICPHLCLVSISPSDAFACCMLLLGLTHWALLLPHCTHQENILDVQLQRNLEYLDQQVGGSVQQPQLRFNADSTY